MIGRGADEFHVVLDQHTVQEDREAGSRGEGSVGLEARAMVHDVIGLPLAGSPRGVDERWKLTVQGTRLAVGVGDVVP